MPLECLREGQTYAAPLHVTFRLKDGDEVREENVYMGEIPLMTRQGASSINGAERVIVSQLHRSPGICFEQTMHPNGSCSTRSASSRTAVRGWKSSSTPRICCGFIWTAVTAAGNSWRRRSCARWVTARTRNSRAVTTRSRSLNAQGSADAEADARNRVFKEDVIDVDSQTVLARRYDRVTENRVKQMNAAGSIRWRSWNVSWDGGMLAQERAKDPTHSATDDALKDIYLKLRPGDPPTPSNARQLLKRLFFDPRRYDLGRVGRYKINQKLGLEAEVEDATLRRSWNKRRRSLRRGDRGHSLSDQHPQGRGHG